MRNQYNILPQHMYVHIYEIGNLELAKQGIYIIHHQNTHKGVSVTNSQWKEFIFQVYVRTKCTTIGSLAPT